MEKEISSGAMLGIVLIALAAVIGLGFGVFAIAKSTANEGIVGVQDSLTQVSESTFADYDQKTVTGSQVKSFITTMNGKSYALLVGTTAAQKNGTAANDVNACMLNGTAEGGSDVIFVNYGALLTVGEEVTVKAKAGDPIADADSLADITLKFQNGIWTCPDTDSEVAFELASGNKIKFNNQTSGLTTVGTGECVPDATKFKANLIKDSSGTIKGVVFEQIAKNGAVVAEDDGEEG